MPTQRITDACRAITAGPARSALCLLLVALLSACASQPAHRGRAHYAPSGRYYPPPGPPDDPWGPYIRQASGRFGIPDTWIRQVMRRESAGDQAATSSAGAMGLMQVMPDTYAELSARYQLGDDPYEPRDNILAGTGYLREMYDRFGAPGFLAAYNAGPRRLEAYLYRGVNLPTETVNYVAAIAPRLGASTPLSGPLAVFARQGGFGTVALAQAGYGGCDPDAAYDPTRRCPSATPAPVQITRATSSYGCDPDAAYDPSQPCKARSASMPEVFASASAVPYSGCDPDAAYDPARRCAPQRAVATSATPVLPEPITPASFSPPCDPDSAYDPARPCRRLSQPTAAGFTPAIAAAPLPPPRVTAEPTGSARGGWSIQLGAFTSGTTARIMAERAREAAPALLRSARAESPTTAPFGSTVLYRARLSGLSGTTASEACARLASQRFDCMVIPPAEGRSF